MRIFKEQYTGHWYIGLYSKKEVFVFLLGFIATAWIMGWGLYNLINLIK